MSILETLALRRAKRPAPPMDAVPILPEPSDSISAGVAVEARMPLAEQLEKMIREAKQTLAIESEHVADELPGLLADPDAESGFQPAADWEEAADDEDIDEASQEDEIDGEISAILESEAESGSYAEESPISDTIRHLSERSARMRSLTSLHGALEGQMRNISEVLALSQRTWASAQPHLESFERDGKRLDILEGEAADRAREIQGLRRANQELTKTVSVREAEVNVAVARHNEVRTDANKVRKLLAERESERDRLRMDLGKAENGIAQFRGDIALVTTQFERESVAKENAERARSELERKFTTLQTAEASSRSKLAEVSLRYEKLAEQVPALIEEYETLQRELQAAHRNGADTQTRYLSARDQVAQLENEIRLSESQSAAEAFAARNEVEMARSQLRTTHEATAELELRMKEMQARLGVNETWRQKVEHETALLERDAENARREAEAAVAKVSELNLRYTTDLLTIDQLRDQNRQMQQTLESVQADNQRLGKFENLYRSAESQVASLRMRLDSLIKAAQTGGDPSFDPPPEPASDTADAEPSNVVDLKDTKGTKAKPRQS